MGRIGIQDHDFPHDADVENWINWTAAEAGEEFEKWPRVKLE